MPDHGEQSGGGSSPTIDRAVEREFNALRDFLAQLEQGGSPRTTSPTAGQTPGPERTELGLRAARPAGQAGGAGEPPLHVPQRPEPEPVLYWWVTLRDIPLLPRVAALRERLSSLPGAIIAQVVDISSHEIRLGVTTTAQVTLQQLEFAVRACQDIEGAEVTMHIPGRAH